MITIFNRKELEMTTSMKRQWVIRHTLATNNVDYRLVTKGRYAMRGNFFTIKSADGEDGENGMYCYYFYVKEKDYDLAVSLLAQADTE